MSLTLEIRTNTEPTQKEPLTLLKEHLGEDLDTFRVQCSQWETAAILEDRRRFCLVEHSRLSVGLNEGEIRCVIMSHKGKYKNVSPFVVSEREILSREKPYALGFCPIARIPFLTIFDEGASGINKTATALFNDKRITAVRGPVIFILLDHDYSPTHMKTDFFRKHVLGLL